MRQVGVNGSYRLTFATISTSGCHPVPYHCLFRLALLTCMCTTFVLFPTRVHLNSRGTTCLSHLISLGPISFWYSMISPYLKWMTGPWHTH